MTIVIFFIMAAVAWIMDGLVYRLFKWLYK